MSLEKAISELTEAVKANTAALQGSNAKTVAPAPAAPAAAPVPTAPRARPAPPAAPAAAPAAKGPDKAAVLAKGTELCNVVGREAFTALCIKHGSATKNVSGLPVTSYAAVIAEAQELIDGAADPAS